MGAFALLNALNGEDVWQQHSENVLDSISSSMVAQPMMSLLGMGTPNSRLTPAILGEIIKENLTKFAKSGPTNNMVKKAVQRTFEESNIVTDTWKQAFLKKAGQVGNLPQQNWLAKYRGTKMNPDGSPDAGVWWDGTEAMKNFIGQGVAAAPVLGFSQAKIDNISQFRSQVRDLSGNWTGLQAKMGGVGGAAGGMFGETDLSFEQRMKEGLGPLR